MTAFQIALMLVNGKGISPERIEKAKALAQRSKVDWADVEAYLPESVK